MLVDSKKKQLKDEAVLMIAAQETKSKYPAATVLGAELLSVTQALRLAAVDVVGELGEMCEAMPLWQGALTDRVLVEELAIAAERVLREPSVSV